MEIYKDNLPTSIMQKITRKFLVNNGFCCYENNDTYVHIYHNDKYYIIVELDEKGFNISGESKNKFIYRFLCKRKAKKILKQLSKELKNGFKAK